MLLESISHIEDITRNGNKFICISIEGPDWKRRSHQGEKTMTIGQSDPLTSTMMLVRMQTLVHLGL